MEDPFSAAKIRDKVWLYGSTYSNMYVLDMSLLVWSSQNILCYVTPCPRQTNTFTTLSDNQIVLHGGAFTSAQLFGAPLSDTWIFDTELLSWRRHTGSQEVARFGHTAVRGRNTSVMILGGTQTHMAEPYTQFILHKDIYWVKLEPDSLKKQCLKVVFQHTDVSKLTGMDIPASLLADLYEMHNARKCTKPLSITSIMPNGSEEDAQPVSKARVLSNTEGDASDASWSFNTAKLAAVFCVLLYVSFIYLLEASLL